MPKKSQKPKQKIAEIQIVDQQKEPCLRALQKKVRNINKKLTQISELQKKNDLKPEQIDKIDRKAGLLQEKEKYFEFIQIYKEIAQQNAAIIRNNQLNELKQIATVLAARQYGAHLKLPQNQDLNQLVKILASPSSQDLNLGQRVEQINSQLIKIANNNKLKKNYLTFVQENKDLILINQNCSNEPQPCSNKSEKEREQVLHDIDQQLHQIDENTGQQHVIVEPHIAEKSQEQVGQKVQTINETVKAPQICVQQNIKANSEPNKQAEQKKEEVLKTGADQDGRRARIGNYQNRKKDGNYQKKKQYKQRYQPKEKKVQRESNDSDSNDSSPEVKQFKREERKVLEDDGFIFVGTKTKPKPRDQKEWHNKQHGRKTHQQRPKNS